MQDDETKHFRSFAERYVVERASAFRVGFEKEDAFAAIMDAKTLYKQIEQAGVEFTRRAEAQQAVEAKSQMGYYDDLVKHALDLKMHPSSIAGMLQGAQRAQTVKMQPFTMAEMDHRADAARYSMLRGVDHGAVIKSPRKKR